MKKARKENSMADPIANEKDVIFAEEAFVVDVQGLLHQIMEEKGYTRADLARMLGVSRARITQIFSDECKNLTIRLLARAMYAMGETPTLTCDLHWEDARQKWEGEFRNLVIAAPNVVPMWDEVSETSMSCQPANDNRLAGLARHYGMRVAA
jgi:transcriptional regulator with XRE-family HTH domain